MMFHWSLWDDYKIQLNCGCALLESQLDTNSEKIKKKVEKKKKTPRTQKLNKQILQKNNPALWLLDRAALAGIKTSALVRCCFISYFCYLCFILIETFFTSHLIPMFLPSTLSSNIIVRQSKSCLHGHSSVIKSSSSGSAVNPTPELRVVTLLCLVLSGVVPPPVSTWARVSFVVR